MIDIISLQLIVNGPSHYSVGDTVRVRLEAFAPISQRMVVNDMIVGWDPTALHFEGADGTGQIPTLLCDLAGSEWSSDLAGINEAYPPQDGDMLLYWYNILGDTVMIQEPALLTTLVFTVTKPFDTAPMWFIPELTYTGYPQETVVYGSNVPGQAVTGDLIGCTVAGNRSDLNGDHTVDAQDLGMLFNSWKSFGSAGLTTMLNDWGPCPQ